MPRQKRADSYGRGYPSELLPTGAEGDGSALLLVVDPVAVVEPVDHAAAAATRESE